MPMYSFHGYINTVAVISSTHPRMVCLSGPYPTLHTQYVTGYLLVPRWIICTTM